MVVVESSVLGADRVLGPHPVELLARMVVEEDDLDLGASRSGLELAEALGMRRLDDDQALDLCRSRPAPAPATSSSSACRR